MRALSLAVLTAVFCWGIYRSVPDFEPTSVTLYDFRRGESWRIEIAYDGSGRIGFGPSPNDIHFPPGTLPPVPQIRLHLLVGLPVGKQTEDFYYQSSETGYLTSLFEKAIRSSRFYSPHLYRIRETHPFVPWYSQNRAISP